MSSQEPVCCDLASGQWPGTWTVSVVFSAPHLPSQVGGSPRPRAGHAARHTQRAVCWGGKHVPRALKVSCFTCGDPGPGNSWNSGAPHIPAGRHSQAWPDGQQGPAPPRPAVLGDLQEPVVGTGVSISLGSSAGLSGTVPVGLLSPQPCCHDPSSVALLVGEASTWKAGLMEWTPGRIPPPTHTDAVSVLAVCLELEVAVRALLPVALPVALWSQRAAAVGRCVSCCLQPCDLVLLGARTFPFIPAHCCPCRPWWGWSSRGENSGYVDSGLWSPQ